MDSIVSTYILTGSTGYIGFHLFLPEIDEKNIQISLFILSSLKKGADL